MKITELVSSCRVVENNEDLFLRCTGQLKMFRASLLRHKYPWLSLSTIRRRYLEILPFVTGRSMCLPSQTGGIFLFHKTCALAPLTRQYSEMPQFFIKERSLNEEILMKRSVLDQLEFHQHHKDQLSLLNAITMLHSIAKITHKYREQKEVLHMERDIVEQGKESSFMELLDFIAANISSCKAQGLANLMWALGKLEEKTHPLATICEREILCHDFALFHLAEINQILTGCAALGLRESEIFERVEESILKEILRISLCETRQLTGILLAFSKVGCGSVDFYKHMEFEILGRGLKSFHNGQIAQFVYAFASQGIYDSVLFEAVEEEVMRRSTVRLRRKEMVMILWAFATAGTGSEEMFCALGNEIADNRLKELYSARLMWVIWSFATRGIADSKVYKAIAREIYMRGLGSLTNRELSLCVYSYALSEIPSAGFMEKLETEVLARDLSQFNGSELAQVAWGCGKVGLTNPKLYNNLEENILLLQITQNQASMIGQGFDNANMGSKELFSHLERIV